MTPYLFIIHYLIYPQTLRNSHSILPAKQIVKELIWLQFKKEKIVHKNNRSQHLHLVYRMLNLLLILTLGVACALPSQTPAQVESIGQITTISTNAREGVLLVRKYVTDTNSWEYIEARKLYGEAQAAFDGWIEQLKADITFGVEPDAEQYDVALNDAIQKVTNFLNHVEQIEQTVTVGSGSSANAESNTSEREDVAAGLLLGITTVFVKEVIVTAGIELWNASQEQKARAQKRTLDYLDTLKWESFEEIE